MAKTIFMAEDDSFAVKIYNKVFVSEGFEVLIADNGSKAKEMLSSIQTAPSLFLFDVMMPGINGFELLEFVKTQEKLKDVPVVFLTNFVSEEDKKKAAEMGAKMYLVKSDNYPQEVMDNIKALIK